MIRALWLFVFLVGYASADDQIGDILRRVEPPLLKVLRGDKPPRILDAKAGRADAERDLKTGVFLIYRYDKPGARVGDWSEWNRRFEQFSIVERPSMHPKIYCDAYNSVMDSALAKKFGDAYVAERSKLLPPEDAKPFRYERDGEQATP